MSQLKTFLITSSVIDQENKYNKHNFEIQSAFGRINISIDGDSEFYVKDET